MSVPGPALFFIVLILLTPLRLHAETLTQRIVTVDSNATEILIALGLGQKIVAADVTSQSLLSSDVPNLGYHRALSAEGILDNNPDWVVGSDHMGPEETLSLLKKAPLRLVQLNSPKNLTELKANITALGQLLGREQEATSLVTRVDQLGKQLSAVGDKQQNIIFLLDLGDRGLSQAGNGTTADALITLLGGHNLGQFSGYKSVSVEALLSISPDVILLGQRSDSEADIERILQRQPLLINTPAGRKDNIIGVNAGKLIAGISLGALDEALAISEQLTP